MGSFGLCGINSGQNRQDERSRATPEHTPIGWDMLGLRKLSVPSGGTLSRRSNPDKDIEMNDKKGSFLNDPRRRLLGQLWVSTMVGTAVVLILQQLGSDWSNWQSVFRGATLDWPYTLDRVLRYALALWFAMYLTVAYLINEEQEGARAWGMFYDPVQSLATLIALGALGFLAQKFTALSCGLHWNFAIAFLAVALIAVPPVIRYWDDWGKSEERPVEVLRVAAAGIGILFGLAQLLCSALRVSPDKFLWGWAWNTVGALGCWLILFRYASKRRAKNTAAAQITEIQRKQTEAVAAIQKAGKEAIDKIDAQRKRAVEAIEEKKNSAVDEIKKPKPALDS